MAAGFVINDLLDKEPIAEFKNAKLHWYTYSLN
jgi:hypothetical protein